MDSRAEMKLNIIRCTCLDIATDEYMRHNLDGYMTVVSFFALCCQDEYRTKNCSHSEMVEQIKIFQTTLEEKIKEMEKKKNENLRH